MHRQSNHRSHLLPKEGQLPLQLVDALDVRHVPPLEGCELRVKVCELNHAQLAKVRDARVRRILVHDDGHIRHVL